jgi:hypothetical protein
MSGIATAVTIGTAATVWGASEAAKSSKEGAKTAASGAVEAAKIQAESQREQLEYLKEVNALPTELRNEALTQLAGVSGIGDKKTQTDIIERAKSSPLYQELMAGRESGEEAILRGASATGGLRSGGTSESLYKSNINLRNRALTTAYGQELENLRGLARLPTGTRDISNTMGNIGSTMAGGIYNAAQATSQGQIAQGQIFQQAAQNIGNIGMQGIGMGIYGGYI